MSRNFVPERVQEQLTLAFTTGIIDFSNSMLADIPVQVLERELIHVTQLLMPGNRLSELSTFITRLPSLQILDLSGNVLQMLPSQVGLLSDLRSLRLGGNPLKELPRSLGLLTNSLKELTFDPESVKWPFTPSVMSAPTSELLGFLAAFHRAEEESVLDLCAGRWTAIPGEVFLETPLECLKLSNNQLDAINEDIAALQNLKELHLDANRFTEDMPAQLLPLTSLTILNLQGNEIEHLSSDLPFPNLRELRVSDNAIEVLPSSLGSLRSLTLLDVSFNQVSLLPPDLSRCLQLRSLRARGNRLRTVPDELSRLPQLEELALDRNPLARLPVPVAVMPSLSKLSYDIDSLQSPPLVIAAKGSEHTLHYMRALSAAFQRGKLALDAAALDRIPVEVCELTTLTSLSMRNNDIPAIPPQIVLLQKLEILVLSHNRIEEISPVLASLTRLQILDLSYNKLSALPRALHKCVDLGRLLLEGNQILSPPASILNKGTPAVMHYLRQLSDAEKTGSIRLENLQLLQIPAELGDLSNIAAVSVAQNLLSSLRPLHLLAGLTALDASQNHLVAVEAELRYLTALQQLDLSHNGVTDLGGALRAMTDLRSLQLGHNPLQNLPEGLWGLSRLETLDTTGCDIKFPPADVISKGVKSLLTFQRMIERGRYTNRLDLSGIGFQQLTLPQEMWCGLAVLNIDRNYCSFIPDRIEEATGLAELRAVSNQLVRLPDAVGSLEALQLLDVRHNILQALPESVGLLSNLTRLRVSGNRLLALPPALDGLISLTELDAEHNALSALPPSVFEIDGLRRLALASNQLVQLPLTLGRATALSVLTLQSNILVRLPLSLRHLTQLTEFTAGENDSIDLPPPSVVSQGLPAIQSFLARVHATMHTHALDISACQLNRVPDFVAGLTGLTSLSIAHNDIPDLAGCLPLLATLNTLDASDNPVTVIPLELGGSTVLRELRLDSQVWAAAAQQLYLNSSHAVRDLFARLLAAQVSGQLSLSGMGFKDLPAAYEGMRLWHIVSTISDLDLSNNALQSLRAITWPVNLRRLDLTSNKFQIPELEACVGELTGLTSLGLSRNELGTIPPSLRHLTRLKELFICGCALSALPVNVFSNYKELITLDCSNNLLTEIKGPIWLLPKLRAIEWDGNDIISPPIAFLRQGKTAVMSYYRALELAASRRTLDLTAAELTYVPNDVLALAQLESLVLDDNRILSLSPSIDSLLWLRVLSMRGNQLSGLPEAIGRLVRLQRLDLSHNFISDLPISAMLELTTLSELLLTANHLTTPPFELCALPHLTQLLLLNNLSLLSPPPRITNEESASGRVLDFLRIEARALSTKRLALHDQEAVAFPREVLRISGLTDMNLSNNRLETLADEVSGLSSLCLMAVEDNLLQEICPALGSCTALLELRLAGNQLSDLPDTLSALMKLALLDLARNHFSTMPDVLQYCTALTSLALAHNGVRLVSPWISKLTRLRLLDLMHNHITALPFQLARISTLQDLRLEGNDIGFPPDPILQGGLGPLCDYLRRLIDAMDTGTADFTQVPLRGFACHECVAALPLTALILNHNGLRELFADVSRLSRLTLLDLSDNEIQALPRSLGQLPALAELRVNRNQLARLDDSLGTCASLVVLSVEDNKLDRLPPGLGYATRLATLAFRGNPITSPPEAYLRRRGLPWVLRYLRALHSGEESGTLQLSSMQLSEVPEDVFMQSVARLHLNCNDIRDVAEGIMGMAATLQGLSLANNKLMRVPTAVCRLKGLQTLILDDNMITELFDCGGGSGAGWECTLPALVSLSVAHNAIAAVSPEMSRLGQLRRLCLDGNHALNRVPDAVLQLTGLTCLSMRECSIAELPAAVSRLRRLQELNLSDNALENLPSLLTLSDLGILRLSNNKLLQLPEAVVELPWLQELSLTGNLIQRLPPDFSRLTGLRILHIDGQYFGDIPREVVGRGGSAVLAYLRSIGLAEATARLDLSGCGIHAVPTVVVRFTVLQQLLLHGNPIQSLPPAVSALVRLRTLTLNNTRVRSLPLTLPALTALRDLILDQADMLFPPADVCVQGVDTIYLYLRKVAMASQAGTLDLSGTNMTAVPVDIVHAGGITILDVSNNRIARLPSELCLMSSLQELRLDGNPLRPHIQDVADRGLEALMRYLVALHTATQSKCLDLSRQELRFFPEEALTEPGLTSIRLDENRIRQLPRKIGVMSHLTELSLQNNSLAEIPEAMTGLRRLRLLQLDFNEFESLPGQVLAGLSALEKLSIASNRLNSLPPELGLLAGLRELHVEGNPLTALPIELGALSRLTVLDFDKDKVIVPCNAFHQDHPILINYMHTLHAARTTERLDLSGQGLAQFPFEILTLTGLTWLSLARNRIPVLPDELMDKLQGLVHLDVESNELTALPESAGAAAGLTSLCALGNRVAKLPSSLGLVRDHGLLIECEPARLISPPPEVMARGMRAALAFLRVAHQARTSRALALAGWRLKRVPVVATDLPSLTDLVLDHNEIEALPSALQELTNLTRLSVADNHLGALPPELGVLTALTSLDYEGNPMGECFPPPDVCARGLGPMLDFCQRVLAAKCGHGPLALGGNGMALPAVLHLPGSTLSALTGLSLDGAGRDECEVFALVATEEQLVPLESLTLRGIGLEGVPPLVENLTVLLSVDLSDNVLEELPERLTRSLPRLRALIVERNRLAHVPRHVSQLTALEILRLGQNRLAEVPDTVGEFITNLVELSVPGNQLRQLPLNLERCRFTLTALDVEDNALPTLPPVVLRLTRLARLGLRGNPIRELPLELGRLLYLKDLSVPLGDLGGVPARVVGAGGRAVIRYMCGLEECADTGLLDLSAMDLDAVPAAVRRKATALTMLKLDDNPALHQLPNWVGELQRLRRLSVRGTPLCRLPAALGAIQTLEEVAVDAGPDTALLSPPPEVVEAGQAAVVSYMRRSYSAVMHRQLDLSGFGLREIPFLALSSPTVLTALSLNENRLESIPAALGALTGLRMLALAHNRIASLPPRVFARMGMLRSLSLQGNPLSALPLTLGACVQLEYLEYDAAALESPPRDVVVKSVQAVRTYLRQGWSGRTTGVLDLSGLELTDLPLEVTDWAHEISADLAARGQLAGGVAEAAEDAGAGVDEAVETGPLEEVAMQEVERIGTEEDALTAAAGNGGGGDGRRKGGKKGTLAAEEGAGAVDTYESLYTDEAPDRVFDTEPDIEPALPPEAGASDGLMPLTVRASNANDVDDCEKAEEDPDLESSSSDSDGVDWPAASTNMSIGEGDAAAAAADAVAEVIGPDENDDAAMSAAASGDGMRWRPLHTLNLSNNCLAALREETGRMAALTRMDLSHNELRALPTALTALPRLTALAAGYNRLSEVPSEWGPLLRTSLRRLYLEHNNLASLPTGMQALGALRSLRLDHNRISELFIDGPAAFPSLRELTLNDNGMHMWRILPPGGFAAAAAAAAIGTTMMESTVKSTILAEAASKGDVSDDMVIKDSSTSAREEPADAISGSHGNHKVAGSLPDFTVEGAVKALQRLRSVSAAGNEFDAWPMALADGCRRLVYIDLSRNSINTLPPAVGNLRRVHELNIDGNRLQRLPAALARLKSRLSRLGLAGNPLRDAPTAAADGNVPALLAYLAAELTAERTGRAPMGGLGLEALPRQLFDVEQLTYLDVSSNVLTSLPRHVELLQALMTLDARDNQLSDAPTELCHCRVLRTLHLDRNRFRAIGPNVYSVRGLQVLTMQGNDIGPLPVGLADLPGLVVLDLRANSRLSRVSAALLEEGVDRLLGFLSELQRGFTYGSVALNRRGLAYFPDELLANTSWVKQMDSSSGGGGGLTAGGVHTLRLAYNEISSLPEAVAGLTALTVLDLSHNALATLPSVICALGRLAELRLDGNRLIALPPGLSMLTALAVLALEGNPIQDFPADIFESLTTLTELTFDSERPIALQADPATGRPAATELIPLEVLTRGGGGDSGASQRAAAYRGRLAMARASASLDLSVMGLWVVPESVTRMPVLTALNLTGNALLAVPDSLGRLDSLLELRLNDNRLTMLPAGLARLTRLEALSAIDNRLVRIDPALGNLTRLKYLDVNNNPDLTSPPAEVYTLGVSAMRDFLQRVARGSSLGQVELAGLGLQTLDLPWTELISPLQVLVLSRNKLQHVPEPVATLTNLTALWLDGNLLSSLPASLGNLVNLQNLALDGNGLGTLPACVCEMPALQRLTVDNNQLRFLHPRMSELQSLTLLSAANNRLTMLPTSLAGLTRLRSLTLAGNPLAPLPPALRERLDIHLDVPRS